MSNLQSLSRIINAPISANAKICWMMIAMACDEGKHETWVRQASLAEQLKCSKSTVGRMLRVLREAGLIVDTGKRHAGKYKIYELPTSPAARPLHEMERYASDEAKKETSPLGGEVASVATRVRSGRGEKGNDIADELLAQFGESWRRRFPLIDGRDGRHSLEAGVREASKYKFWHKHSPTMSGWVEEWLTQAVIHYSRKPKPKQQNLPV